MNKLGLALAALIALPVYAAEYAAPAASQAAGNSPAASQSTTAQPAAAESKPAPSAGSVARAQFTNAIQDREPVDKVSTLLNDKDRVYFFSEIKDAPNQKITHRWEHDGKVVSEISFDIGGNRWRVYSNKTLDPQQTGEWKVSVVDDSGRTLDSETFKYEAAKAEAAGQPAAPAAGAQPAAPTNKP